METKTIRIAPPTEKTNISTIKIPNSSFYYKDEFNSNWVDDNPVLYAMNIAFESHIGGLLNFPSDRIIYASNDFTFREREKKNDGNLNLPYFSYYMTGYSEADRPWWNNFANLNYPMSDTDDVLKIGQKIKIYPVKIEYEGVALFSQHKDMEYAFRQLAYDNSNETILFPSIETSKGDTLNLSGVLGWDIEYNPSFTEADWLIKNNIFTIGVDFNIDTFLIMGDTSDMFVAKDVIIDFITAKKLVKPNVYDSPDPKIIFTEYFNLGNNKGSEDSSTI